jgi:hypothetical protein
MGPSLRGGLLAHKPHCLGFSATSNSRARATNFFSLPYTSSSDLTIVDASDSYLHATMTWRNEIRGAQVFDVFPDNPSQPKADGIRNLNASLARVLSNGRPDTLDIQKYDVRDQVSKEGSWPGKYWVPVNFPVFGHQSPEIVALINRVEDVTRFVHQWTKEQEPRKSKPP